MKYLERSPTMCDLLGMSPHKGFSLVELMVAIAILAIAMSAVGAGLYASYESSRENVARQHAEALISDLCERFKAGNVGTSKTASDPCQRILATSGKAGLLPADNCWNPDRVKGTYYCEWTSTATTTGYYQLDVTVYWGGQSCDRDNLSKCKRKLRMINYYKPSGS
jgi:prepilin-type N-terminal cleavage/methylation domain-containing protein